MFLVWLRSPITTDDMWQKVKEKVSGLVDWKAVVTQWREKILQLTCILDHQLYSQRSVSGTEARTSSPLPTSSNTTPPSPPSPSSTLNSSESFAEKGEIAIPLTPGKLKAKMLAVFLMMHQVMAVCPLCKPDLKTL